MLNQSIKTDYLKISKCYKLNKMGRNTPAHHKKLKQYETKKIPSGCRQLPTQKKRL